MMTVLWKDETAFQRMNLHLRGWRRFWTGWRRICFWRKRLLFGRMGRFQKDWGWLWKGFECYLLDLIGFDAHVCEGQLVSYENLNCFCLWVGTRLMFCTSFKSEGYGGTRLCTCRINDRGSGEADWIEVAGELNWNWIEVNRTFQIDVIVTRTRALSLEPILIYHSYERW